MSRRDVGALLLSILTPLGSGACNDEAEVDASVVDVAAEEFIADARAILNEIDSEVAKLDNHDVARTLGSVTEGLEELRSSTGGRAEELRGEVTAGLESLTQGVERAKLEAAEGSYEFIVAARGKLSEIAKDLSTLREEADVPARVEALGAEADSLTRRVSALEQASLEEVAEARVGLAAAIATLSATIQREWLEARYDLTAD